jgi:mannosyltransferase
VPEAIRRHPSLILLPVLLVAFWLRVHGLAQESLWVDEGYSISLSQHAVPEIIQGTAADQHPPLYYLVLHFWLKAGTSVFHIRLLSAFLGLLSVALMAPLGSWLGDERVRVWGTALLAVLPLHVWYSQEARMYVLLSGLGILSTGLAWVISKGQASRAHWAAYLLSSAAGIYTHNFFFFLLPIQNLLVALRAARGPAWRRLAGWLGGQAALLAIYLPWLPIAVYQARYHSMTWLANPDWAVLRDSVVNAATGLSRQDGTLYTIALGWTALALLLPLLALRQTSKDRQNTLFGILWFVVPVVSVFAISQRYPLYQSKQLLIFIPGLVVLVVQGLRAVPRPASVVMIVPLLVLTSVALYNLDAADDKHGWREAALYINTQWQEGDAIYLNPAAASPTLDYYLPQSMPMAGYPPGYDVVQGGWEGEIVTEAIVEAELAPLARRYDRIWLIQFSAGFWDPGGHLSSWLANHGELTVAQDFRGVDVGLYQVAHDG